MSDLSLLLALWGCPKQAPVPPPTPEPAVAPATDERPAGHWQGKLTLPHGVELTLVAHLKRGPEGAWEATLDSPDQGGYGIPVQEVTLEGDRLVLEVAVIGGRYEGSFVSADRLEGTWTQGPLSLPLALERTEQVALPQRPQEPKPPFPYTVEEVRVPSVEGVILAGTLTRPEGEGPFPSVVLVTGSGPQDRDEALMGHKPFAVLADHLTRAGIAVLRFDDRGVGQSTGTFKGATTPDFAKDAAAALTWLKQRPESGLVGCLGHSEGALVCPLAQAEAKADFLVLLAGPSVSGAEILVEQTALLQQAGGLQPEMVEAERQHSRELFALIREKQGAPDLLEQVIAKLKTAPSTQGVLDEAAVRASAEELLSPWFQWFLTYEPVPTLKKLDVPVLALFGERDLQVPPSQNSEPMRQALGSNGTIEVLPALNHLFQPAQTGSPAEYAKIETTIDPVALERISSWILARAQK